MIRPLNGDRSLRLIGSVVIVALGVAGNVGLNTPYRLLPSLLLMAVGIAGVATAVREYPLARLHRAVRRGWVAAFVAFLPYALATAPATESAAAVGTALSGPVVSLALEAIAGAVACCAVAITVLYGLAVYGVHPGRPSPEDRVLTGERKE